MDLRRATLGDLVEWLKKNLGYGDEFSVITDQLLYDVEFDDNVENHMTKMGITEGTFITVIDDNEGDVDDDGETPQPKVNLVLAVANKETLKDQEPILPPPEKFTIPSKPKKEEVPAEIDTNGSSMAGIKRTFDENSEVNGSAKKRKLDDATAELSIRDDDSSGTGKGRLEVFELDDSGVIEID